MIFLTCLFKRLYIQIVKYRFQSQAPINYTPPDFQTRALQHSNVKLTWEEDEPDRKRILKRKFNTKQVCHLPNFSVCTVIFV